MILRHRFITTVIAFSLLITSIIACQAQADEAKVIVGKDYFNTLHKALQDARDSVYVAMYIINVDPEPTDNPASILLDELINAKKRGVYVKVILEDSKFKVNYNAFNRLKKAGIDVHLDSPQEVLHGKGIVIDSRICILGSVNWSRASIYDNREFSSYMESAEEAKRFLKFISGIELSPAVPVLPEEPEGVRLSAELLTHKYGLTTLFTNRSEKAFDLYLYLVKKAREENSNKIRIDYKELGEALGYTGNFYFNVRKPLNKLVSTYGLIRHKPWSKYLTIKSTYVLGQEVTPRERESVTIPYKYWSCGLNRKLPFKAKYMYLISLLEARKSARNPYWFRSNKDLAKMYHIGERAVSQGTGELEKENILEVYRHPPPEFGKFEDRYANSYRLNPLVSEETFRKLLSNLSARFGADLTQKACDLSAQLNEPRDIEKMKIFIGLINTYGYDRVREVNSQVASKRRETGFHSIEQTILLLKQK